MAAGIVQTQYYVNGSFIRLLEQCRKDQRSECTVTIII